MRQEVKAESAINLTQYPNKTLEGYYLGHRIVTGKFKEQFIHDVKKEDGKKVSFYGFTSVNISLEQVDPGTYVWITYKGKSSEKNKYGQQVHVCLVECDSEKKVDIPKTEIEPNVVDEDSSDLPF